MFFTELTEAVAKFDFNNENNQEFTESLRDIINRHTNMLVSVLLIDDARIMCSIPSIDQNNLLTKVNDFKKNNISGLYALARNQNNPIGWVDYKTGKVHGVFTDIRQKLSIGKPFFTVFTPEQLAASILHEVGHSISNFAQIATDVIRGLGMMTLIKDLMLIEGENIEDRKIALVKEFSKESGVSINRTKQIIVADRAVDAIVELNKDFIDYYRSETGNDLTDRRLWETMADQYAVRMGGGAYLGSTIHTLAKMYPMYHKNTSMFFSLSVGLWGLLISTAMFSIVPVTLAMVWLAICNGRYDSIDRRGVYHGPAERIRKIRQEMILQLRLNQTDDKLELIKQIDELEKLAKDSFDDVALTRESAFWFLVTKDRKQYINNTDLDKISRNDLFVKAHQLT